VNDYFIPGCERLHDDAVKLSAIAIHRGINSIQHFHAEDCALWEDIHFVLIRWIEASLQVKGLNGTQLGANRLDARSLPVRRPCQDTNQAQDCQGKTMHGLGPSFQRNRLTAKKSLRACEASVNAKSEIEQRKNQS